MGALYPVSKPIPELIAVELVTKLSAKLCLSFWTDFWILGFRLPTLKPAEVVGIVLPL